MTLVNIYLHSFCILVCAIILLFLRTSNYRKDRSNGFLSQIVILSMATLASNVAILSLSGNPDVHGLMRALFFFFMAAGPLLLVAFTQYLVSYIEKKTKLTRRARALVAVAYAASAMDILCLVITQFNGFYYIIDAGSHVVRQDSIWLSDAFSYISMAVTALIIISYRGHLSRREFLSMLSYIIMPVLAMPVSAMRTGVDPIMPAMTLSIIIFYIGIQNDQEAKLQQKDLELSQSRIAIMLSQIQPHFLFNTMISIRELCELDPMKAQTAMDEFALYLRGNMDSLIAEKTIPFNQELGHVKAYLALQQMRYQDTLTIKYDIQATDFTLPPLTLQPIVENAVRHGLSPVNGGLIEIRTMETKTQWRIVVYDNGREFNPQSGDRQERTHIGISNVRERLELLQRGRLSIEHSADSGTVATITLPKATAAIGQDAEKMKSSA